jgi:hypothetical protein
LSEVIGSWKMTDLRLAQWQQILPLEKDRPGRMARSRVWQELQDGKRGDGLARSRLTNERDGLSLFHGKGDAIDGERLPLPLPEGNGQIADNQKRPFC